MTIINKTAGRAGKSSAPTGTASDSKTTLTTNAPSIAEPVIASGVEAEFCAMPAPGKTCPYSGLQRVTLYALAREGLIRTVALRRPGTTRGRRLIVLSTLREYLRKLDAEQNGGEK